MARALSPVTQLLADLVAIPSVNPTGNPGTEHTGEERLARYAGDFLSMLGAKVRYQMIEKGRPNLIATFGAPKKGAKRIVFAPHLDTVSVAGMTVKPFDPVVQNGRLYGRGSSDTKGPMAAMLMALAEWSQSSDRLKCPYEIIFVGLMGEEAGNDGAHALAESGFQADFMLVGEPTQMRIVHAHKSALWLTLTTRGKACHASTPEQGVSAISKMRKLMDVLEEKIGPALQKKKHKVLGPVTMNLGTIRGGSKVNIVPDFCELEVDFRTVPGHDNTAITRYVGEILLKLDPSLTISATRNPPPLYVDPKNPWIRHLQKTCPGLDSAPWFCDAAIFAEKGIPAIALGPGSIAQAHTKDEFIRVSDLESGTRQFRRYLTSLHQPHFPS
jgi:acetylornithine deacetylase/succinyl-diaminopimelate desuccinylase family protein